MAAGGILLADRDSQSAIELFIDQQVFIDMVRGNEQVEEFAAHTEVTTFERRGSDLYLEGNILFTAYLDARDQEAGNGGQETQPEGVQQAEVEHLQHRMPFDLSVPIAAESAGLFSVQVQVPEATVDVLGPGWLHIRAVLQVEGLPHNSGFAAHCGAQEVVVPGSLAPADEPQRTEQSTEGEQTGATPEQFPYDYSELLAPFSVTKPPTHPVWDTFAPTGQFPEQQSVESSADAVEEVVRDAASQPADEVESSLSESGWKLQLQGADRALHGVSHPEAEADAPADARDAKEAAPAESLADAPADVRDAKEAAAPADASTDALLTEQRSAGGFHPFRTGQPPQPESDPEFHVARATADSSSDDESSPHLSYHFEHTHLEDSAQSPADIVASLPAAAEPLPESQRAGAKTEAATQVSVQAQQERGETVGVADPAGGTQMSYTAVPEEPVELSAAQWFWKTMNIPAGEGSFTMKFRIVQVAETVEEIANYYNISVTELLRANEMSMDTSIAGSLLYIPVLHT